MPGPLTRDDLLAEWRGSVDPEYARNLEELGDGLGIEVYEQAAEQLAAAASASDRSSQALYVLPHSGQSAPPAAVGELARVSVDLSRSKHAEVPLVFPRGLAFAEVETDCSDAGPVEVLTGRLYGLLEATCLVPGALGPLSLDLAAARSGEAYNLAAVGGIRRIVGISRQLAGVEATIVPGASAHRLVTASRPDAPSLDAVGQYVELGGTNAGRVVRIVGIDAAAAPSLGAFLLAATTSVLVSAVAGTFIPGEEVTQGSWKGRFVATDGTRLVAERTATTGELAAGALTGSVSGAVATVDALDVPASLLADTVATWRTLDWEVDLGISVSNAAQPTGGQSNVLGDIGLERLLPRAAGESQEAYRARVAAAPDVVTPRAVRRAVNRILSLVGAQACLREVGQAKFRGLFFDGDPSNTDPAVAFAYDLDFATRPADRFKLVLDYLEFRAFGLVGVPALDLGDFGCAYDDGPSNAYDDPPFLTFYDGFPMTAAAIYSAVWAAVDATRAYGVGFDLYLETGDCS